MATARVPRALLLAAPGVVLGLAGLLHPPYLTYTTAQTWTVLHIAGLFVFPLVAVALVSVVRGASRTARFAVAVPAFVYMTAYSALDVISGIGAGYVTWRLGPNQLRPDEVSYLFDIGGPLGKVGSWALLIACALVAMEVLGRLGFRALPVLALLPGALLVHVHHIFAPEGAAGMALIGLATGWVALVDKRDTTSDA